MVKKSDILPEIAQLHIEELGLSVRCCRKLKHAGVVRVCDVMDAPLELLQEFEDELVAAFTRAPRRIRR